ncbi:MAG: hypothetical protein PF692_03090 [Kiritimatiellae bacterium]|nr:hypothetical protein [Kiritimatiellia bacterium]
MSDPNFAATSINVSKDKFKFQKSFSPFKTAAASALPPPKPAAIGILFRILIWAPPEYPVNSFKAIATL